MSETMLKKLGYGVKFERIRRITGYISLTSQFGNAKQQEEQQRVKHN